MTPVALANTHPLAIPHIPLPLLYAIQDTALPPLNPPQLHDQGPAPVTLSGEAVPVAHKPERLTPVALSNVQLLAIPHTPLIGASAQHVSDQEIFRVTPVYPCPQG